MLFRIGVAALIAGLPLAPALAKTQRIEAAYTIKWLGLPVGTFNLTSNMAGRNYSLNAKARIGMIDWTGVTQSAGTVTAKGPSPTSYSFTYSTGEKSERIAMKFAANTVEELKLNPPAKPSDRRVPVTRTHMQGVVDPLSAIVALSAVGGKRSAAAVCAQKVPVFDGKQRYDLVFSPKGEREVNTGEGYRGKALVCGVQFVPISGHKPSEAGAYAAGGIEVWMIPAASAEMYVPYYVVVPTSFGSASITAARFNIETPGSGKKALIY